jgi:hypothetical protein
VCITEQRDSGQRDTLPFIPAMAGAVMPQNRYLVVVHLTVWVNAEISIAAWRTETSCVYSDEGGSPSCHLGLGWAGGR